MSPEAEAGPKGVLPPACLLAAIGLAVGLHFLLPLGGLIPAPYNWLGLLPALLGVILNVWSDRLFKKADTTVKPFEESRRLITAGPFRASRHPMYLGMTLTLLGLAVLLGTAAAFAPVPLFAVLMDRKFIAAEEEMMEEKFGEAYRDYRRRVRRWM